MELLDDPYESLFRENPFNLDSEEQGRLIGMLQTQPGLFQQREQDALQQYAQQLGQGIQLEEERQSFNLFSAIGQLGSGFLEGLTTLPVGEEPENIYDAIARSAGSVAGFVGFMPGPGMIGKLGGFTLARAAGLGRTARSLQAGPDVLRGISVPMQVGRTVADYSDAFNVASRYLKGRGLSGPVAERLGDIAEEAVMFSAASGIASWQGGIDAMLEGAVLGGLEGAAERGVVNFMDLGRYLSEGSEFSRRQVNRFARMTAGSLALGLPATITEQPAPFQVYQYLLGAYFGGLEPPFEDIRASRYISNLTRTDAGDPVDPVERRSRLLNVTEREDFRGLEPIVQDAVTRQVTERYFQDVTQMARQHPDLAERLAEDERITDVEVIQFWSNLMAYEGQEDVRQKRQRLSEEGVPEEEIEREIRSDFFSQMRERQEEERPEEPTPEEERVQVTRPEIETEADEGLFPDAPFRMDPRPQRRLRYERDVLSRRRTLEDHEGFAYMRDPLRGFTTSLLRDNADIVETDALPEGLPEGAVRYVTEEGIRLSEADAAEEIALTLLRHQGEGEEGFERALTELRERFSEVGEAEIQVGGERRSVEFSGPLQIDPDTRAFRSLRQAWHRLSQDFEIPKAAYSPEGPGPVFRRLGREDVEGNRVQEIESPALIDRVTRRLGLESLRVGQRETIDDEGKPVAEDFFLEEDFDWAQYVLDSDRQGQPFLFGVKDKGKAIHLSGYPFPDDTNASSEVSRLLSRLETVYDDVGDVEGPRPREAVGENYDAFREAFEGKGLTESQIRDLYARQVLTGIRVIEEMNGGLSFEEMVRANLSGEGDFILSVADLNKRAQVMEDTFPTVTPRYYSGLGNGVDEGGIRFAIARETRGPEEEGRPTAEGLDPVRVLGEDTAGEVRELATDQHLDGVFFVRSDVFEALAKDFGLDPEAGTAKGTVSYSDEADSDGNPLGMMMGKFAIFRADEDIDASLRDYELGALMYETAAKQRGKRSAYETMLKENGRLHFYTPGSENPNPYSPEGIDAYTLPYDGLRVNMGSSEDPRKALSDQHLARQFLSNVEDAGAAERLMERYIRPSIEGDPEANDVARRHLEGEDVDVSSVDVDDLGIQTILDIVTGASHPDRPLTSNPLYQKVWRHLLRLSEEDPALGQDEGAMDAVSGLFEGYEAAASAAHRLLKTAASEGLLDPVVLHSPITNSYVQSVLRSYIVDRATKPKAPYSGKAVFQPTDPWLQRRLSGRDDVLSEGVKNGVVQPGYVILQDGWRNKNIRWLGDEEKPLGEAFEEYMSARESGAERLQEMEDLLTFAAIRVPADSPSGTRMVRIAGFSGRQGAGAHFHPRDMTYQGGADLDIDRGFLYQDPDGASTPGLEDRPIRRFYESRQDEHDDPEHPGYVSDPKEGTIRLGGEEHRLEDLFVEPLSDAEASPLGVADPRMRFQAARGAAQGNKSLGVWALAGRMADDIYRSFGPGEWVAGRTSLEADLPDGSTRTVFFEGQLAEKKKAFNELRTAGINYTADAGGFAGLRINSEEGANMLARALFEDVRYFYYDSDGNRQYAENVPEDFHPTLDETFRGEDLRTLDDAVDGRIQGAEGKASLFETLNTIWGATQRFRDEPPKNPWYQAVNELGSLNWRNLDEDPAYIGRKWENEYRPRLERMGRAARDGDPEARRILAMAARKGFSLNGREDPETGELVFSAPKDPELTHQDLADVATLLRLYDIAKRARRQGVSEDRMTDIAREVDDLKARYTVARRGASEREKTITAEDPERPTIERVSQEIEEARKGLSPVEADYFDAYLLGSLSPQDKTIADHYAEAEARFKENPFRYNSEGERVPLENPTPERVEEAWKNEQKPEERDYWWRTNQSRIGFMAAHASRESVRKHLQQLVDIAQATRSEGLTPAQEARIELLKDPTHDPIIEEALSAQGEDPSGARVPIAEVNGWIERMEEFAPHLEPLIQDITNPEVVGERRATENQQLLERFQAVLKRHPALIYDYVDVFTRTSAEGRGEFGAGRVPQMAERADLQMFLQHFDQLDRRVFFQKIYEEEDETVPFKSLYHWVFPHTIGEVHRAADLQVSNIRLRTPAITPDGPQMLELREAYSTFEKQHQSTSLLQKQQSSVMEMLDKDRQERFNFLDPMDRGDRRELVEAVVLIREARAAQRDPDSERSRFFIDRLRDERERIETLRNRRFSVADENGVVRKISGDRLIGSIDEPGRIDRNIEETLRDRFETYVRNHEAEARWLVNSEGDAYDPTDSSQRVDPYESLRKIQTERDREGRVPIIGQEAWMKIHHELWLREQATAKLSLGGKMFREPLYDILRRDDVNLTKDEVEVVLEDLRKQHTHEEWEGVYPGVGRVEEGYWPHVGHPRRALDQAAERLVRELEQHDAPAKEHAEAKMQIARLYSRGAGDDLGQSEWLRNWVMAETYRPEKKDRPMLAPSMRPRSEGPPLEGYLRNERALEMYDNALARAYHKTATVILNQRLMRDFRRREAMGEDTERWARMGDRYTMDVVGAPTVFPQSWLDDPGFSLKSSPTWWFSDQHMEEVARGIERKLGTNYFGFFAEDSDGNPITDDQGNRVERPIGSPASQRFYSQLNHLSKLEAKWELMSLLASTKAMTNNYVGGSTQTIISSGIRPWTQAGSLQQLREVNPVRRDEDGNKIGGWETWEDVNRSMEEWGIIESFIASESEGVRAFQEGPGRAFWEEAFQEIRENPMVGDGRLTEIAEKHGLGEAVFDSAAWFMRSVERRLRRRSALAHYIKAREAFEANGFNLEYDHPWLQRMAQKGVEATQFLYDNANRPAFARSTIGRVVSRFQLWAWNSVRFRQRIFRDARAMGFQPGTPRFERFKRMATMDLFVFALAAMFPATLFENVLPPPWDWLEDLSDYLFGDEEERQRAFFGQLPYPLNVSGAALPPASRIVNGPLTAMLSGDWDRFASYHIWTWFPFGLLGRSVYNTAESPVMGIEQMTGFPIHRIHNTVREEREKERAGARAMPVYPQPEEE